ncbi:hypothetical protein [Burkholderia lata]|uniref:hypothetical protein n=1 Tax=Burkholderia lata (strain ATCC 17760 / DSM 23089 / LMG 22485 / NCIMB 9086 / R18194 / 383) TaxID=482957 RepID=UPI00158446FE|nr:hypothetical protein [Burkholderia lata]
MILIESSVEVFNDFDQKSASFRCQMKRIIAFIGMLASMYNLLVNMVDCGGD